LGECVALSSAAFSREVKLIPAEKLVRNLARIFPVASALALGTPAASIAQSDFPTRTVKIVVPLPAGPVADAIPRLLAGKLSERWGQPVIVENRPGATMNIGAAIVSQADPDGHTLLATPSAPLVHHLDTASRGAFDPSTFVPISIFGKTTYVLVANTAFPASNIPELIKYARANPGKASYASPGIGSAPHLVVEMLQQGASIRLTHIPYKGLGLAMTDLLGRHVDLSVDILGNTLPLIREGKLKAIGVADKSRIRQLPGVSAFAESFPQVHATAWYALVAPSRTSPRIVEKIASDLAAVLRLPDVARRFDDFMMVPLIMSPTETAAYIEDERRRWQQVAGVKAQ
jgi:tripartite-type tricarboxylate transporter receptor subunit TctC